MDRHAVGMPFKDCKSRIFYRIIDRRGYLADAASDHRNGFPVYIAVRRPVAVGGGTGLDRSADRNLLAGHDDHIVEVTGRHLEIGDPVGGTGGKAGGAGTRLYKIRTVAYLSVDHYGRHVFVGQLQRERLRLSGCELLLKRGQDPGLYRILQLVVNGAGAADIASRSVVKQSDVSFRRLSLQLFVDGGEEHIDHSAVADHALADAAGFGQEYRIVLHHADPHGPGLAVSGKHDSLVQPAGVDVSVIGYKSCQAACRQGLSGGQRKRYGKQEAGRKRCR